MSASNLNAAKERPILFSGPMVRAILEGWKSQTRRVLKSPPASYATDKLLTVDSKGIVRIPFYDASTDPVTHDWMEILCPYGAPGDRLWVRETWRQGNTGVLYRANDVCPSQQKWRPSIFLKREACRLVLQVAAVRVERLQEISCADAIAEGIAPAANSQNIDCDTPDPRHAYRELWDSINAKRAPWASNPWVWVVEFRNYSPISNRTNGRKRGAA